MRRYTRRELAYGFRAVLILPLAITIGYGVVYVFNAAPWLFIVLISLFGLYIVFQVGVKISHE